MRIIHAMRLVLCLLLFLVPLMAVAQNAPPAEAPQITFEQQVDIVVTAKKDPSLYDLKFHQQNDAVTLDATVDRNVSADQAKTLAQSLIMLTKVRSIDDKPKQKNVPGKGLYDYRVTIMRPDGVVLITALKPKAADLVEFEDPFAAEPLTRADVRGR